MSQITIYLEPDLVDQIKQAADSQGLSQSKWIATVLKEKLNSSWTEHVRALVGSWPQDFPEVDELRNESKDLSRETL